MVLNYYYFFFLGKFDLLLYDDVAPSTLHNSKSGFEE